MKKVLCESCGKIIGEREGNLFVSVVTNRRGEERRVEAVVSSNGAVRVTCDHCGKENSLDYEIVSENGDKLTPEQYAENVDAVFPGYPCHGCASLRNCGGTLCDRWKEWYSCHWRNECARMEMMR